MSDKKNSLRFAGYIYKHISKFEDLECDGTVVVCTVCNVKLVSTKIAHWREHLNSKKHTQNKKNDFLYGTFVCDLIFMFSVCNIPLHMLDKEPFRLFWSKYVPQWDLPKRTTARRKLTFIRKGILKKIEDTVKNRKIWLALDEMSDALGNHVAHVIARFLDPAGPSPAFLLASRRIETVNVETIRSVVVAALKSVGISSSQVLMLVTDVVQGQFLQTVFPGLIHVTCMVHGLHLVAEKIRKNYTEVDTLIAKTKQIFVKAAKRVEDFRAFCPDIPLPPEPILTRCGTWLEAVSYYDKYFNDVKTFVLQLNPGDSQAIYEAQQLFNNDYIEGDIDVICNNYNVVLDSIHKLESSSLPLASALELLDNVHAVLQTLTDVPGVRISKTFSDIFQKNPGYEQLRDINRRLSEKHLSADDIDSCFNFANVTCVDVERSFSLYTNMFTERRRRFSEENIETVLLMQMFQHVLSEPLSSVLDS